MHRSYLFAPGHDPKLVDRVFTAGADAAMLDLEDAVPPDAKAQARRMVADAVRERTAWVRITRCGPRWPVPTSRRSRRSQPGCGFRRSSPPKTCNGSSIVVAPSARR
jgi:HpcH/HpaI aldolase/citrate lyase family